MNSSYMSVKGWLAAVVSIVALAGCGAKKPEEHIQAAKAALGRNDLKVAGIEIKNALQIEPTLAEGRLLLGQVLQRERNPVAAEVEFRKAHTAGVPPPQVVPHLASTMLQLGQHKKVVEEFGNSRLGEPSADASLQTTLASAYSALGKRDKAAEALQSAFASRPGYAPALMLEARLLAMGQDLDGALLKIGAVTESDAKNSEAWKLKGDLLQMKGDLPNSLATYLKSVEADSTNTDAEFALIRLQFQMGKVSEASARIDQLKSQAPQRPQTKYFQAQLAFVRGDLPIARDFSQQLLRLEPNSPLALLQAGAIALQMKSTVQAEAHLSRALQIAPQLTPAARLLVTAQLRSGLPDKALATLNSFVGKGQVPPELLSLAGETHLQAGDPKRAEQFFAQALKLNPKDASTRTSLAITRLSGDQAPAAMLELQEIATSDDGITADMALIAALMVRGEHEKSLTAVEKLQKKRPEKPEPAMLRGRTLLAMNNPKAAREAFAHALVLDPTYFAAVANLAGMDLVDKKPDEARERFESFLAKNPKHLPAALAVARLAAGGAFQANADVVKLINRAIDADPTDAAARVLLVDYHLRAKNTKEAIAVAQAAAAAIPNSPEVLDAIGRAYQASGDLNQAIATFGKLSALQPLSPAPLLRLASAQEGSKDITGAEQSLKRALTIKPDYLEAQRMLVQLAIRSKRYPDAIKVAREIQTQRPRSSAGFVFEGDVSAAQADWKTASASYRVGLAREPATALAAKLNMALTASKQSDEARKFATSWMAAHPRDNAFLTHLGDVALSQRSFADSEMHYLAALKIRPDDPVVLNNLAWVAGQLRKDGIPYAERALQLSPNQPAFMDTLAKLLSDRKEHDRAVELQSKALALQPNNPELRLNLAKILLAAGNKPRARSELESLAQQGEKFAGHTEVAALLKSL